MTTCPKCGYTRKPADAAPDYQCPSCGIIYAKYDPAVDVRRQELAERQRLANERQAARNREQQEREELAQQERQRQDAAKAAERSRLDNLCLTTTHTVPGREVDWVIEVISAECAFGMNVFKDFFAGVSDFFGGRNRSTQNTLRDARRAVMRDLRQEAFDVGADAVIGIDLDYSEFSGGGKSMLFVVATGTAVKLKQ